MNSKPLLAAVALCTSIFTLLVFQTAFGGQPVSKEVTKANKVFAQGNFPEAIKMYQAALAVPSNDMPPGMLHTKIGDSYFRLQDHKNAREAYRQAMKRQDHTKQAQTQYWIGFCTMLMGHNAEAVKEFLLIPETYPDSGMLVSTSYYWAGRASEQMGKKDQAAEFYRKAAGKGNSPQGNFAMKKAESIQKGTSGKQ